MVQEDNSLDSMVFLKSNNYTAFYIEMNAISHI